MAFELGAVQEVERGEIGICSAARGIQRRKTVTTWLLKYANAVAQRVNRILKQDFLLEQCQTNREGMKQPVKESIHIYNTQRPHLSSGMKTPERMHNQQGHPIRT